MVNHIINGFRKLAQKEFKTKQNWVGKMITGNCARDLNLTMQNWYMHKQESVLENEIHLNSLRL